MLTEQRNDVCFGDKKRESERERRYVVDVLSFEPANVLLGILKFNTHTYIVARATLSNRQNI